MLVTEQLNEDDVIWLRFPNFSPLFAQFPSVRQRSYRTPASFDEFRSQSHKVQPHPRGNTYSTTLISQFARHSKRKRQNVSSSHALYKQPHVPFVQTSAARPMLH